MAEHYRIERIICEINPDKELAKEMGLWGKIMGELEMVPYVKDKGWAGNIGFKKDGIIWVTLSGAVIDDIKPEEIMGICSGKEGIRYFGQQEKKPTSEWEIYWEIFNRRPEVNAVLHGHDLFALETAEQLRQKYPEQVGLTKSVTGSGTAEFREELSDILTDINSYLIGKGHGFFALGEDFEEAGMVALEFRTKASKIMMGEKYKALLEKYHIN